MLTSSGFDRPACKPGSYLSQKCTFDADGKATQGECKECSRMSFSVGGLQDKCQAVTECSDDEYEFAAPSASSDRRCKACSKQCARDEYVTSACSSTANLQCKACTSDPGAGKGGWFLEASCGGKADAAWAACKECDVKVKAECTLKSDTVCDNCPDDATSIVRSVSKMANRALADDNYVVDTLDKGILVSLNRPKYTWSSVLVAWVGAAYFRADIDKAAGEDVVFTVSTDVIVAYMYDSREGYNFAVPSGFQRLPPDEVSVFHHGAVSGGNHMKEIDYYFATRRFSKGQVEFQMPSIRGEMMVHIAVKCV